MPRRESEGAAHAAAVATGRDSHSDAVTRRMSMRPPPSEVDATERRRLGREYLARRNQEMLERQKKSQTLSKSETKEPSEKIEHPIMNERTRSSSSFDKLVNDDGSLREDAQPETDTPLRSAAEMIGLGSLLGLASDSGLGAGSSGFRAGSRYGNPFGDEFELSDPASVDHATTPRPLVPPKVALEEQAGVAATHEMLAAPVVEIEQQDLQNLSYEEQLVRALSLSSAESEEQARKTRYTQEDEDPAFAAAIAESLRETQRQSKKHDVVADNAPLIDEAHSNSDDELYTLSPQPTNARPVMPYDPVREAAAQSGNSTPSIFHSMSSLQQAPPPDLPRSMPESLINIDEEREITPSVAVSPEAGFTQDIIDWELPSDAESSSASQDFPASTSHSVHLSDGSVVEIQNFDVDSMSSEDDGVRTPGSWTDIGSEVGDSERSESETGDAVCI